MPDQTKIVFQGGVDLTVMQPMSDVVKALSDLSYRGFVGFVRSNHRNVQIRPEQILYLEEIPEGSRTPPESSE
jgi:hypothetical protein